MVVAVKDRRERMLRCLDALLAQDHPSYEILVADNGSSDGTPQACLQRAAQATVPVRVERVEPLDGLRKYIFSTLPQCGQTG